MNFDITMTGFVALYIFMLAGFAGWVIIGGVPAILHTPLMSGANAIHGVILVGAILVTGAATIPVVLIERMQAELDFDIVLTAYGLTEATGFGTMCRADDDAVTVATTCGRPIADFELRIDSPDAAAATLR